MVANSTLGVRDSCGSISSADAVASVGAYDMQQQTKHTPAYHNPPPPPPPPTISNNQSNLSKTASFITSKQSADLVSKSSRLDVGNEGEGRLRPPLPPSNMAAHKLKSQSTEAERQFNPPPPPPPPPRRSSQSFTSKWTEVTIDESHTDSQVGESTNEIPPQASSYEALSSMSNPSSSTTLKFAKLDIAAISAADSVGNGSKASSSTPKSAGSFFSPPSWFRKNRIQTDSLTRNFSGDTEKKVKLYYPPVVLRGGKRILASKITNELPATEDALIYYGERMEVGTSTISSNNPHKIHSMSPTATNRVGFFEKTASWIRRTASSSSQSSRGGRIKTIDSLADFHESEWTPQDSSYGAAIPLGGWIPKHIRRMIEYTMIVLGIVCFVYVVVATSIKVTDDRRKHQNSTKNYFYSDGTGTTDQVSGCLILDDDKYIAYTDDCIRNVSQNDGSYYVDVDD